MKKRNIINLVKLSAVCIVILFIIISIMPKKPFENIKKEEIKEVTVELYPPNTKVNLDDTEIENLVEILTDVVIYNKDNSYGQYDGQMVVYTIIKTDDTVIKIQAYNPFLIIDGVGYRSKYQPCEELSNLGNKIGNIKE